MKQNAKTDRRRLLGISMRAILALVLVGTLVAPLAVQAELKSTDVVYAFDFDANYFRNSMVRVPWDGTWVPFLHELYFDTGLWPDPVVQTNPDQCAAKGGTRWAGNLEYGLVYVDSNPLGGLGFQESRYWSLISCDRNGDKSGTFDSFDREPPPDQYDRGEYRATIPDGAIPYGPYAECTPDGTYCRVLEKDKVVECSTGTCEAEIVTLLQVNLDLDCDGYVDQELIDMGLPVSDDLVPEPQLVCFYAEGRTPYEAAYWQTIELTYEGAPALPPVPYPIWKGNPQGRISVGGGDKTVNFDIESITAVDLASFDAAAQDNGVLLSWETASEIDNLGFNIYRAESQVGELVKINPSLIPSKNLGSSAGAAYSFLDESAAPGATYYYWLEDLDMFGASAKHGPVVGKAGAARALPGRLRPPPMPGNAL